MADDVEGPWEPDPHIPNDNHVFLRVLFPLQVDWMSQNPPRLRPNAQVIRNSGPVEKRGMSCNWDRYRPDPLQTRQPNTEKHTVDEYGVVRFVVGAIREFKREDNRLMQDVNHDPVFHDRGHLLNNRAHSLATGNKSKREGIEDYESLEIRNWYAMNAEWEIMPDRKYWPENPDE